ncbi:MAG: hypothetical protein P8X69_11865, partial [Maritimibacter sp.]
LGRAGIASGGGYLPVEGAFLLNVFRSGLNTAVITMFCACRRPRILASRTFFSEHRLRPTEN